MNPTQGVFAEAWDLYKRNFAHFATIAVIVYAGVAILQAIFVGLLGFVGAILSLILTLAALFWVAGTLVEAVSDAIDGRIDLSIGQTFDRTRPKIGTIAAAGILAGIAIVIGLILIIIPGLILMTLWCVIIPAIVLENRGVFESFSRSQQLVSGFAFNAFGVVAGIIGIDIVFNIILGLILAPLPNSVSQFLSGIISGTLFAPFFAAVTTVLYFRLRNVKEGGGAAPRAPGTAGPPPPAQPPPSNV
jgi:tetrahydromethanopterin S-methyltransferase subunit G